MCYSVDNFDKIDKCIKCGEAIKVIKLDFIKKKIENISDENLKLFKYCSNCKRKMNKN
ncbi:hypothetical protein [Clostridium sp. DJ247]|uniref:hypothetical protein n=1 Tax=Clostridium sp. DJ247 TaxID=2726188 RepID=UPI0016296562|nr:hypothetical protein [Clostridium sp. DJ247]MBC2581115.1 hypothetical protein [Clostridium sp. DJ247]